MFVTDPEKRRIINRINQDRENKEDFQIKRVAALAAWALFFIAAYAVYKNLSE